MPILFGPLEAIDTPASADGLILVSGSAFAEINLRVGGAANGSVYVHGVAEGLVIAAGTCVADGGVIVDGAGTGTVTNVFWANTGSGAVFVFGDGVLELSTTAEPEAGAYVDGYTFFDVVSEMAATFGAETDSEVFIYGDAWCGAAGSAICDGTVAVFGEALESLDILEGDIASVITYFPAMYGLSGGAFERVVDVLAAEATAKGQPWTNVLDMLALVSDTTSRLDAKAKVTEVLRAFGIQSHVVIIVQQEGLALSSVTKGDYRAIERVVDRLLLEGHALSYMEAVSKIADVLAAGAVAETLLLGDTADVVVMVDAANYVFTAIERVVDSGVLFGTERQSLSILASDSLVLSDAALSLADVFALIRDGLGLIGRVRLDTGEYTAWVVNTESAGVSTYTNYPFNSFAMIGGVAFGLTSMGMYALDAEDDDGEPINARLRVGLTDMGTRLLKSVTEAYIGFTSDEKMVLRAITPNPATGAREAVNYEMKAVGNASLAPQRFELGKGVKAVDWDFELENIDGADFDLHSVEFLPIKLSRRTRS